MRRLASKPQKMKAKKRAMEMNSEEDPGQNEMCSSSF